MQIFFRSFFFYKIQVEIWSFFFDTNTLKFKNIVSGGNLHTKESSDILWRPQKFAKG